MASSNLPVPGTVHLVDIQGTSALRHGKDSKDIILVPQPTADPNDPFNWSSKRKLNSSVMQIGWTFFASLVINGLTPAYLLIEEETGISIGDLNTGNGLMYLFFGIGTLLTQPFALNFGRRPAAVISFFITAFLVLWASFMKTAAEWYANRVLIGIFFSTIECLIEICITDTKFAHERGLHMGFYTWSLFGGAFLSPIPAGFLADAVGWQWINRMYFIVAIAVVVVLFFGFEETMFYRPHTTVNEFLDDEGNTSAPTDGKVALPEATAGDESQKTHTTSVIDGAGGVESGQNSQVGEVYTISTYAHRLKLWGHRDARQPNTYFKFFFLPIYLLRYPSIFFSGLLVGSVLAWHDARCLFAGWLNDTLATWMARRNNGIKEPEARLWASVVSMILHPAGCILYGVGAANHIHWIGLCIGIVLVTTAIVMGATLALSYAVDCYKEVAGEAIVSVILIRNIIGFAFGYAVTPMVSSLGLQNAFILIAVLGVAMTSLSFVQIAFGKKMRTATAASYWKLVEQHGFKAQSRRYIF